MWHKYQSFFVNEIISYTSMNYKLFVYYFTQLSDYQILYQFACNKTDLPPTVRL